MKWENVCNFAHDSIFVAIHHSWLFVDRFDFIKAHKPYFYIAKVEKFYVSPLHISLLWKTRSLYLQDGNAFQSLKTKWEKNQYLHQIEVLEFYSKIFLKKGLQTEPCRGKKSEMSFGIWCQERRLLVLPCPLIEALKAKKVRKWWSN